MANKLKRVIQEKTKFLDEWFSPRTAKAIRLIINDIVLTVVFTLLFEIGGRLCLLILKTNPEGNAHRIKVFHELEDYIFIGAISIIGTSFLFHLAVLLFGGGHDDDDGGGRGGSEDEFVLIGILEKGRYNGIYIPISYLLGLAVSLALKQDNLIKDRDVYLIFAACHLFVLLIFYGLPNFLRRLFPRVVTA